MRNKISVTLQATVECEAPNERLYKFVGNLTMRDQEGNSVKVPLNAEQVGGSARSLIPFELLPTRLTHLSLLPSHSM